MPYPENKLIRHRQIFIDEPPEIDPAPTMKISEIYRNKALACEKLAREVPNQDFKAAWEEIAIEWHALASRMSPEASSDYELVD